MFWFILIIKTYWCTMKSISEYFLIHKTKIGVKQIFKFLLSILGLICYSDIHYIFTDSPISIVSMRTISEVTRRNHPKGNMDLPGHDRACNAALPDRAIIAGLPWEAAFSTNSPTWLILLILWQKCMQYEDQRKMSTLDY